MPSLTAVAEQNRVKLATHVEFPSILQLNQRWVQALLDRCRDREHEAVIPDGALGTSMPEAWAATASELVAA